MKRFAALALLISISFVFISAQTYNELTDQGLKLAEAGELEKAEETFRRALKQEPANSQNVLIFSNLGTVQRGLGKYDDAIESYTYALNIAPRAVPILLSRATAYMELGKTDRAYVDYCQVLDSDKTNVESLLMRAYIYVVRRDYNAARIDYNRLLEIEPANYNGRLGLVTLNQKEKKFNEAIDIIGKMITEFPEDATLYVARADIEVDMNHVDLALIDLEEAMRLAPDSPDAFLLRGDIYLSQKKKVLARQDFEKAIQLGVPKSDLSHQMQQCR